MESRFNVVVIGTGPGGEGAAMQAVKHGKSVAVVERDMLVGGSCTQPASRRAAIRPRHIEGLLPVMRKPGTSLDPYASPGVASL